MGRIEEKARELAEKVAGPLGFSVEWVEMGGGGRRPTLRVYIEKEGGVTLDDCALMSREMSALLDVENLMPGPYNLEVSSPGLDRPLFGPGDYRKYLGRLARVVTREPVGGGTFHVGRLKEASDEYFVLETDGGELDIPYRAVTRARLEVETKK